MSKRFTVDKKDGLNILKVLIWTVVSAVVVALINLIGKLNVPVEYLWLMPLVNVILVAVKKFCDEKIVSTTIEPIEPTGELTGEPTEEIK
jgi:hypothetical protein